MTKKAPREARRTPEARDAPSTDETPVGYMLRVMRDPSASPTRRDSMAKSATPYLHKKPAAKKKKTGGDQGLRKRLELFHDRLRA